MTGESRSWSPGHRRHQRPAHLHPCSNSGSLDGYL